MTDEREREIEAREKAATGVKWFTTGGQAVFGHYPRNGWVASTKQSMGAFTREEANANAEFVAHAREDIPYLLAQLREAEGKLEAVEELAERIRLCAAEAGSPKQAALLTVLLELDRILHPKGAE